jgi:hypothetical protein
MTPHLMKFDIGPEPYLAFDFDADPDPAFNYDADPDPASKNNTDLLRIRIRITGLNTVKAQF